MVENGKKNVLVLEEIEIHKEANVCIWNVLLCVRIT